VPVRYRLSLEWLEPSLRVNLLLSLAEAVVETMTIRFPDEQGFEQRFDWEYPSWMNLKKHSVEIQESCRMGVLSIWKGGYRGLRVKVIPRDPALRGIEVRILGFSPKIESWIELVQKHFDKYFFLIKPIYFLYGGLLFPLVMARALLALRWRGDVTTAIEGLRSVWTRLQGQWQDFPLPARIHHAAMTYFLALLGASGALIVCILAVMRWVDQGLWSAVLTVLGTLLGVTCIALLAGLVMSLLGMEPEI